MKRFLILCLFGMMTYGAMADIVVYHITYKDTYSVELTKSDSSVTNYANVIEYYLILDIDPATGVVSEGAHDIAFGYDYENGKKLKTNYYYDDGSDSPGDFSFFATDSAGKKGALALWGGPFQVVLKNGLPVSGKGIYGWTDDTSDTLYVDYGIDSIRLDPKVTALVKAAIGDSGSIAVEGAQAVMDYLDSKGYKLSE